MIGEERDARQLLTLSIQHDAKWAWREGVRKAEGETTGGGGGMYAYIHTCTCMCTYAQREPCGGYPLVTYKVSHIPGFEA